MPFPTSPHVTCVATTLLNHSVAEYRCVALTIINAATAVLITQDPESASSAYQCWVGTATYCCTRCVCVCVFVCVCQRLDVCSLLHISSFCPDVCLSAWPRYFSNSVYILLSYAGYGFTVSFNDFVRYFRLIMGY